MYDINLEFFFCNYSCPSCVIKYLIKKLFHSIISRSSFQNENLLRFWTKERNNSVSLYSTFQKWKTKKISNFFLSKIEKKKRIKRSSFIAEKLFTEYIAVEDGYNIWRGMCCTRQTVSIHVSHHQLPCPLVYRPSRLTGMHVNEPRGLFEGGWVTFRPFCMQNGAPRVKRRRAPRVASRGSLEKQ